MAESAYLLAEALAGNALQPGGVLAHPTLKQDFDLAAYVGGPWTVQATLLALVYPIVISFVAIMLQRKANGAASLNAYVIDSGVIPAGASSIALTLALGAQYFGAIYDYKDSVVFTLVFNWSWLSVNVLLTGLFLSRTVSFLQDDVHQEAFKRLAVNVSLRQELAAALTQRFYFETRGNDWDSSPIGENQRPKLTMHPWADGTLQVTRKLGERERLVDVHMNLVALVGRLWRRRAIQGIRLGHYKKPVLSFPAPIGLTTSGEAKLCFVKDGPLLSRWEQLVIACSFVYRSGSETGKTPSTNQMLEELAAEVESQADKHNYRAAQDAFKQLSAFHQMLLQSCIVKRPGGNDSMALLAQNVYTFGDDSFSLNWIKQYREVNRVAVRLVDSDQQLLARMAGVPRQLAYALPVQPENVLTDALHIATNLAYELGNWWMRQAQASTSTTDVALTGLLPPAFRKPYEQAIIALIGGWGQFEVKLPDANLVTEEVYWEAVCARARIYARHIEQSAKLLLDAISRGDETASIWLCDAFLKWPGSSRQFELKIDAIQGFPDFRTVGLSLTALTWAATKERFLVSEPTFTRELGEQAVSLAIFRHWESMRFVLILLLLENTPVAATTQSREVRLISNLLTGTAFKPGNSVSAKPLDGADALWHAMVSASFGDAFAAKRLSAFTENLRWDKQAAEVPGWPYAWSGSPGDVTSKLVQFSQLLATCTRDRNNGVLKSKSLVESFWRDTAKLREIDIFTKDVGGALLSQEFRQKLPVVQALREALGKPAPVWKSVAGAVRQSRRLRKVAIHERSLTLRCLDIDRQKVKALAQQISAAAFAGKDVPNTLFGIVKPVPKLMTQSIQFNFPYEKEHLSLNSNKELGTGFTKNYGNLLWDHATSVALSWYVASPAIKRYDLAPYVASKAPLAADVDKLLYALVADADGLSKRGIKPAILVSTQAWSFFRAPYGWDMTGPTKTIPADLHLQRIGGLDGEKSVARLNGSPVFEVLFQGASCFVVSLDEVSKVYIEGADVETASQASWVSKDDENVTVKLTLRVSLVQGSAST